LRYCLFRLLTHPLRCSTFFPMGPCANQPNLGLLRLLCMGKENPQSELARLEKEQHKAKQDEVFGGFSAAERAEYNRNSERIHALEIEFTANRAAKNNRSLLRQSRDSTRTRFAKQTRPPPTLSSLTAAEIRSQPAPNRYAVSEMNKTTSVKKKAARHSRPQTEHFLPWPRRKVLSVRRQRNWHERRAAGRINSIQA
jgi:hypothetical protein